MQTTVYRALAEDQVFQIKEHSTAQTYGFDKCGPVSIEITNVAPEPSLSFDTLTPTAVTDTSFHTLSISTLDEANVISYTITLKVSLDDYVLDDGRFTTFTITVEIGKCQITNIVYAQLPAEDYEINALADLVWTTPGLTQVPACPYTYTCSVNMLDGTPETYEWLEYDGPT